MNIKQKVYYIERNLKKAEYKRKGILKKNKKKNITNNYEDTKEKSGS